MANAEVRQTVIGSGNIFTATGDVRINYQLPPVEAEERRVLLQLAASVKQFWIAGVLERSVHEAAMIELRKEARPDAVQHPWERVLELPGQPARALSGGQGIGDVFIETGRALLLLGEPGAGKTVTLLELARDLIGRFEKDPAHAPPVVLNLSTWAEKRGGLGSWMETELKNKYFVPPRRSRAWLRGSRLNLLLDGLDEVPPEHQAACVQAVNAFLGKTGAPGIAVCCRFADYLALPVRLRFTGAVCLQPLTPEQIDDYLERGGNQLAAVRTVLRQDGVLRELARSPLLLNVIGLAYRDLPVEAIADDQGTTVEGRRRHLFDRYVERMFQRVAGAPAAFPPARTREWLGWLASRMRDHSLTIFSLDQLQPSWLPTVRDRWRYALASRITNALVWALAVWGLSLLLLPPARFILLRGTIFVVAGAIVAGAVAGIADGRRVTSPPRPRKPWPERFRVLGLIAIHVLVLGTVFGAMSIAFFDPVDPVLLLVLGAPPGLVGWWADAVNGLRTGLFFGLVFGLRSIRINPTHDTWLSESLRLSWASARKGAKVSAIVGAIVGLLLAAGLVATQWSQFGNNPPSFLAGVILGTAGVLSLIFAIVGAIFGMFAPSDLPRKVRPVQWLWRSAQNALLAGIVVTAGVAVLLMPLAFVLQTTWTVPDALLNSCGWGIVAALWYGGFDALQHVTLLFMLRRRGCIPKNYVRFLDYAARLIVLQKVGSGYLFVHRQLLDYFAAQYAARGASTRGVSPPPPAES